jgi:O-antigen/teichoic acid export membrane protein
MRGDPSSQSTAAECEARPAEALRDLLCERSLARNVLWNLAGAALPLLVAIWAIPRLLAGMGTDRFGLLGIIWAGIGYFSLFDLGIGAALAKLTAERLGRGETEALPELLATGLRLLGVLGVVASLLVAAITPWVVAKGLSVPEALVVEATGSLWILAATLPLVTVTSGLTGILRAHQRFDHINRVRIPLGVANFVAPVLMLSITPSLIATTALLALSRAIAWFALTRLCRGYLPITSRRPSISGARMRELIGFGGWLTVSNVVGPLMVYFDRFFVGALAGMTAVALYTTPYELITRLWIVPDALFGVVFTAFAMALAADGQHARALFGGASRALALTMSAPVGVIVLYAPEGLEHWLGPAFATESATVLRWLAVGVYINCFARLPFAALQAAGRPDLTAKLHLGELPVYLLALWTLTTAYGIVGTAAAWTLRIVVDTLLLYFMGFRKIATLRPELGRGLAVAVFGGAGLGGVAMLDGTGLKGVAALLVLTGSGVSLFRARATLLGIFRGSVPAGRG